MADGSSSIFTLLGRFSDQGVSTYRALDAHGQFFQVHFLDPARVAEHKDLLEALGGVSAAEQGKIIWAADVEGRAVIVTEPLEGSSTLAEWIAARTPEPTPEPQQVPPKKVTAELSARVVGPGEFTRLFGPDVSKQSGESEPSPATPDTFERLFGTEVREPEEEAAAAAEEEPETEAGTEETPEKSPKKEAADTFDRLFGPGSEPLGDAHDEEEAAPPAEAETTEPGSEPGGLGTTRELRPDPPQPESGSSKAGGDQPDSFLRLFGPKAGEGETAPSLTEKRDAPTRPSLDPVKPPERDEPPGGKGQASNKESGVNTAPGEFTRLFGHTESDTEGTGGPKATVKPQERDTDDILKALERRHEPPPKEAAPPPPPVQPQSAEPVYQQPVSAQSEFDRVVRGRERQPSPPAGGEAADEARSDGGGSPPKLGRLALILGAIVVAAVILVVLFAVL